MSEVKGFSLPYNFERLMCYSCTIVDTYYTIGPVLCKRCGYNEFADSTQFEDAWVIHQKNLIALSEAEDLVHKLKQTTETFDKGWFSTWNSYDAEQLSFETPDLIDPFNYFSGDN